MILYRYQNYYGVSIDDLPFDQMVIDLIHNESGCIHFFDGTQIALSFDDGVPIIQFDRKPTTTGMIKLVLQNLGMQLRDAKVCSKEEFMNAFEIALKGWN